MPIAPAIRTVGLDPSRSLGAAGENVRKRSRPETAYSWPMEPRSVLSFGVISIFALSVVATSKPRPDSGDGNADVDAGLPIETAIASLHTAAAASSLPPAASVPCTTALLRGIERQVRVAAVPGLDPSSMMLVDGPVAAGMSRAAPRQNHPDDG